MSSCGFVAKGVGIELRRMTSFQKNNTQAFQDHVADVFSCLPRLIMTPDIPGYSGFPDQIRYPEIGIDGLADPRATEQKPFDLPRRSLASEEEAGSPDSGVSRREILRKRAAGSPFCGTRRSFLDRRGL